MCRNKQCIAGVVSMYGFLGIIGVGLHNKSIEYSNFYGKRTEANGYIKKIMIFQCTMTEQDFNITEITF